MPANISESEVAISKPGSYGAAGTIYKLSNDITSSGSTIFLGKDVTLDLNGYSITFADAGYERVPNYSFEEGLIHWDVSKAPGAKIEVSKVHVFVGDKILRLSKGEEIVSPYINLHMYKGLQTAFFDYTADVSQSVPVKDIPRVKGKGTVTIKNGIIKNCTPGVISWGIQSTAEDVTIILDNVKIINVSLFYQPVQEKKLK